MKGNLTFLILLFRWEWFCTVEGSLWVMQLTGAAQAASWAGTGRQNRKAPPGKWPESWFPGRPDLTVFSVCFRKGSKPTSVGWPSPFTALKNTFLLESNILERKWLLPSPWDSVPFKILNYILQRPGLPADLAATHVPGEPLVQPPHAQVMSGDMQTKLEILIILFGWWDKWLVLSMFLLIKVLTILRITKPRLETMTSHLKARYVFSLLSRRIFHQTVLFWSPLYSNPLGKWRLCSNLLQIKIRNKRKTAAALSAINPSIVLS